MKIKNLKSVLFGLVLMTFGVVGFSVPTFATTGISMSPMNQKIVLTPGETYYGSFQISNGATNDENLHVKMSINPFYVDENYTPKYDQNNGDYNQIVNWTTIDTDEGTLTPNGHKEVHFAINVPENAPAGGQYMAITATSGDNGETTENGQAINVKYAMAHIIFAEIAGTTERSGEITNISVPSFLFSGQIAGTSSIKNTGNVHSTATYKLQVFPLFSNEEVYTNEENPEEKTILPNRTLTNVTTWNETPSMGIFNVVYTVEFEGVVKEVKKLVIVCPIWLLIIIIAVILLIVFTLLAKSRKNKKK